MSAERHALEAALEYSKGLEGEIKHMRECIDEERMRSGELRRKVRDVKDAVGDRDRTEPMQAQCSMPETMGTAKQIFPEGCCPNCGHRIRS